MNVAANDEARLQRPGFFAIHLVRLTSVFSLLEVKAYGGRGRAGVSWPSRGITVLGEKGRSLAAASLQSAATASLSELWPGSRL